MTEPSLLRRIELLERRVARGRVLLAFVTSILAVFVLVAQADPEPKHLVGRSLKLVDKTGKTRFHVQFDREGVTAPPALQLSDAQGRAWLSAGLRAGRAELRLQSVQRGAGAGIDLSSLDRRARVWLEAASHTASIGFSNALETRLTMSAREKASATVTLFDSKGNERLILGTGHGGSPAAALLDEKRAVRATFGSAVVGRDDKTTRPYALTFADAAGTIVSSFPTKD